MAGTSRWTTANESLLHEAARNAGYASGREAVLETAVYPAGEAAERLGIATFVLNKARYRNGIRSYVPVEEAREVVEGVLALPGWTPERVAEVSELSLGTVEDVVSGSGPAATNQQVTGATYARLLAVRRRAEVEVEPAVEASAPTPRSSRSAADRGAARRRAAAEAAGFLDWSAALAGTADLSAERAAEVLSVSPSTVSEHRRRSGLTAVGSSRYRPLTWSCSVCGQAVADRRRHDETHDGAGD